LLRAFPGRCTWSEASEHWRPRSLDVPHWRLPSDPDGMAEGKGAVPSAAARRDLKHA
jgi:hypothetical protein